MEVDQELLNLIDRAHKADPDKTEVELMKIFMDHRKHLELEAFANNIPRVISQLKCNRMRDGIEAKKPANLRKPSAGFRERVDGPMEDSFPILEKGQVRFG